MVKNLTWLNIILGVSKLLGSKGVFQLISTDRFLQI